MTSERGTEELTTTAEGPVLTVTFNRPEQHNAMTWAMYEGLHAACERADADPGIRVLVLRGAGERAFVAGTDIGQFAEFAGGFDGVEYERRFERVIERLADVSVPTLAAVRGVCVGGGLAIAAACDLRIATPDSRFGVPIARTLGNCLSMNTYNLLVFHLGPARTLDLLLNARLYSGEEAHAAGFVAELAAAGDLDSALDAAVQRLLGHAPITMWATKRAVHRLRRAALPDGDDLVSAAFGSEDFQEAVRAFGEKRRPEWRGR
ncbi:enoyl-CoA hydratase/isomerase family protein [Marinitenerispora sediminis]|uniref:Enoyl-CoA hydratase n=1 Tax=Marinitenerispora sediminis TaxID=1931232 RepID=A0A368SZI2_9ACTN|nr:enoyl-CoA hydratase/isomerase family protein [Marinitenerispora sediminis]RCV51272.1 enoyl-CoA hydratase [Marinitenerispora sediminis]RCV52126.1 enoyl-CoA hydratase [Marinitenerispora sediminis]RCV57822.1 enoyl-CoA hydratase [Marinitenerispora sediminis]